MIDNGGDGKTWSMEGAFSVDANGAEDGEWKITCKCMVFKKPVDASATQPKTSWR